MNTVLGTTNGEDSRVATCPELAEALSMVEGAVEGDHFQTDFALFYKKC